MTAEEPPDAFDRETRPYCPRLGGEAPFRLCRTQGADALCGRILQCWGKRVEVVRFLIGRYGAEALRRASSQPREDRLPRLENLVRGCDAPGPNVADRPAPT
jgi:hypothetical protein